ncbi:MAG TPA: pepsin/retropepsin-like aspartic protease family protein [Pyrinomonadaceae bacterium]|nr:pepsin/retropepsin-like aspartic protease family protein [Pyrinomonadaceae bacterium]
MRGSLKTTLSSVTSALLLALLLFGRATPATAGAARLRFEGQSDPWGRVPSEPTTRRSEASARRTALPSPVSFRESDGRGLLVRTWVNGAGPFTFALDTGAGATILSSRTAGAARVEVESGGRGIQIGGLSGAVAGGAQKAFVRTIALGSSENTLPARGLFVIATGLPSDVDGILDPSEAFAALGFRIDIPAGQLSFFDPGTEPIRASDAPPEGAVVPWLTEGGSRRPFVMLAEGRRALLDTGSGFGLAVDEAAARALGIIQTEGRGRGQTRDLAGGEVHSRRIRAATVSVGALVLRGVPTDLLTRAEKGAPVILGRDALRPFRMSFDPVHRLIMLDPREG